MPLGTEVNLGPGDVVLDGVAASPPPKKGTTPVFGSCLAGWTKTQLGTEVDHGPGHIVLGGVPSPGIRGTAAPPLFSADVYCGHSRPSQLLLSSCLFYREVRIGSQLDCSGELDEQNLRYFKCWPNGKKIRRHPFFRDICFCGDSK